MRSLRSSAWLLAAFILGATPLLSACRTETEIVLGLDVTGALPPVVSIKLRRATPWGDVPSSFPDWIEPVLGRNGAYLELRVKPPTIHSKISLLPKPMGEMDLNIDVSAPGYAVTPDGPVDVPFKDGLSQVLSYELDELPPPEDGGMDGGPDGGAPTDAGMTDDGGGDAAMPPVDMSMTDM